MEIKYYLPISSTSLAHYFGCACIKPSKYFDNKQEDLQDKFNDFLLITTHFGMQQTDCCLELVFTKQETNDLIDIKNGFYLYEKPLPITRIRKIFFTNKERKEQTITNINMSTAFVPDDIVEVVKGFDDVQLDNVEKPKDITNPYGEDQIKKFDSFLGGLALMRLAGEEYMNYSENYFATLSFFNTVIQRDLEFSKINIDPRYRGAFTGESGFQKIIPYLNKTIDETDISSIAQEENQTINKDKITRIIDLNSLDKWTYTVAILNTYGVGNESKKKRIDELILSNFHSGIKAGKSEGIALCYGINRGYSAFSNKYSLGNKEKEKVVKFQLNSQLDYYTIESLYQYVFNSNKSDEFSYLDWRPKLKCSKLNKKTDYKILDVVVIGKKKAKVSSLEYLENLSLQFFQKDSASLFRGLLEKVREIIYNDAKEEIEEDFNDKILLELEKTEKINAELFSAQDRMKELQQEVDSLSNKKILLQQNIEEINKAAEQNKINESRQQDDSLKGNNAEITEESLEVSNDLKTVLDKSENTFDKALIIKIVNKVYEYQSKNIDSLKKEAKEKGINEKLKKDELILALITSPETKSNNNTFNE